MRMVTGLLLAYLGLGSVPPASAADPTPVWNLECRYDNGSSAFRVDYGARAAAGDLAARAGRVEISAREIRFHVAAGETTLLQDCDVRIDRTSLKWTTGKPGWGGSCRTL